MFGRSRVLFVAVLLSAIAGCAGHPVSIGLYTPYPRNEILGEVHQKIVSLGYTVQKLDTINYEIVADRPSDAGSDSREEIVIRVAPDHTGSNKLSITSARVLAATADRPVKRVTASAKTNGDANAVLQMYMKQRKATAAPNPQPN